MKLFRNICIIVLFSTLFFNPVDAQNVYNFSKAEAIEHAMNNNYEVIYSEKNIEAAKQQMREATSFGLPQISGSVDYTDNIALPTSVIPGDFFGQPGEEVEIQFGTKYNMNAGLFASQLIFDGRYIVGLQTAKVFMEKASVDFFKDKVAVKQQVANSYYNVLSTEEAMWVVDTTLAVTKKLAEETSLTYEVGFVEDIDVDQLELLVVDLEASKIHLQNQLNIAHAFLKFYLGLNEQDSIILKDDIENLISTRENSSVVSEQFNYRENVDYVSLAKQKEIRYLQVKLEKTAYIPSLK